MNLTEKLFLYFNESNREAISVLAQNLLAVTKDSEYDSRIIKSKLPVHIQLCMHYVYPPIEAARTYFKTKKNADQRKTNGKAATKAIAARRRQRKHNVWINFNLSFKLIFCYRKPMLD